MEQIQENVIAASRFSDFDISLFREGKHYRLYNKLGSHKMEVEGVEGFYFAVWAPNAKKVSVIGNFNYWNRHSHELYPRWDGSGIWEGFVPGLKNGEAYKYFIESHFHNFSVEKADPFARRAEEPPRTASITHDVDYEWKDDEWLMQRMENKDKPQPMSTYEMHLGSWRRVPEDHNRPMTYRELAEHLPQYLKYMGFTHVEFLPAMEHPFYGSWGYQTTGFFAPTSRFGTPEDFKFLVDALHEEGIGVLLDWVPSHFPGDEHGLAYFDGTHLFEHADPRLGYHPDWKSYIFNFGRNEVRSFLISSAMFWLDQCHADGIRVDAVASMLYLDYSRNEGEWIPNIYGGRENLESIAFLQEFNSVVHQEYPDIKTIAEESTAYPGVTRPVYAGGLGFDMKWMMGWMHDTLEYFSHDPVHRKYHHNEITFSIVYAFSEQFMLPLSHDEVVYGKGSMIGKMPGDDWQKFANLRALYSYMMAHPGQKLIFMGGEFGQFAEWAHDYSLDWHLAGQGLNEGLKKSLSDLNKIYQSEPALYEYAFEDRGFEWLDSGDAERSTLAFRRKGTKEEETIIVVCNFTPVPVHNYRVGVPFRGVWKEIYNSDNLAYGGSDLLNQELKTYPVRYQWQEQSVVMTLPPLGVVYLKYDGLGEEPILIGSGNGKETGKKKGKRK